MSWKPRRYWGVHITADDFCEPTRCLSEEKQTPNLPLSRTISFKRSNYSVLSCFFRDWPASTWKWRSWRLARRRASCSRTSSREERSRSPIWECSAFEASLRLLIHLRSVVYQALVPVIQYSFYFPSLSACKRTPSKHPPQIQQITNVSTFSATISWAYLPQYHMSTMSLHFSALSMYLGEQWRSCTCYPAVGSRHVFLSSVTWN